MICDDSIDVIKWTSCDAFDGVTEFDDGFLALNCRSSRFPSSSQPDESLSQAILHPRKNTIMLSFTFA